MENCQRSYYEVRVNGKVTSTMSFIDCQDEELAFKLLYSINACGATWSSNNFNGMKPATFFTAIIWTP
jgi:hypothetical protein